MLSKLSLQLAYLVCDAFKRLLVFSEHTSQQPMA
jgi:hypothetical protein